MERSELNLRSYPGFCLKELRKITKPLSQNHIGIICGQDSWNPGPPAYKARMLTNIATFGTFWLRMYMFCAFT
jgi:hypothetical protein